MQDRNDLIYEIAKRVRELADMDMSTLREANGYGCDTPYQARQKDHYKTRGQIMEEILTEEFLEEF